MKRKGRPHEMSKKGFVSAVIIEGIGGKSLLTSARGSNNNKKMRHVFNYSKPVPLAGFSLARSERTY